MTDESTASNDSPQASDYDWPIAEPDEIEKQIIRVISAIPEEAENWVDMRAPVTRLLQGFQSNAERLRDDAIKERWTKEIVRRVLDLGRKLKFAVNDSHNVTGWGENWMHDVIWRDLQPGWERVTVTDRLPLVLECTWYESGTGLDRYPRMSVVDRLMLTRAEHRVMVCQCTYAGHVFNSIGHMVRATTIVTSRSGASRPPATIDRDQCEGAVRCIC